MKSKTLFLFFSLFAFCKLANSQVLFSNRYGLNLPSALFSGLERVGDTLYIIGVSGDTSDNFVHYHYSKNLVTAITIDGHIVHDSIIIADKNKDYETFFNSLIKTHKGFVASGASVDTFGTIKMLLIQYDSILNVTGIHEYKWPDSVIYLMGSRIIELRDNNLIISGSLQYVNFNSDIFIAKIDSNGQLLWWRTYGTNNLTEQLPNPLQLTDSSLLVGYERNNEFLEPMWDHSHTEFMVLDTGGNILRQWQDANDSTYTTYGLQRTLEGGFAYCGLIEFQQLQPYYSYTSTEGVITKLDSSFNILWRRRFNTGDTDVIALTQLHQLPDSSFIAAGHGSSWNPISQLYTYSGWFIKLSANGDSVWSRQYRGIAGTYGYFDDNEISDFELLPDGGLIAAGVSTNDAVPYQSQQGWLIRLDSMGCLIPGCDTLRATDIKENNETIGVKVYPNPASNMVYVLIKTDTDNKNFSLKVFDATGKLMAQEPSAPADITYLLNTSAYACGMYFVEIMDGEQHVLATRKFVKE